MAQGTTKVADTKQKWGWGRRLLLALLLVLVLLLAVVGVLLAYFNIPGNAAGMAAKSVCSAAFVAGRSPDAATLMEQDVLPASSALAFISTDVDTDQRSVTAQFLGMFDRRASLVTDRGCVLGADPDPASSSFEPAAPAPEQWPDGDAVVAEPPAGVDTAALAEVVDAAFVGSGDPAAANARGVAVVQDGQLLVARDGADIPPGGVGSSYLWASVTDWARLGQLMLDDGQWDGEQLVAPGWLEVAATPAVADGEGRGYGAQTWIPADPVGGRCRDVEGIPEDTLTMQGHWGQVVAMVPSRNAVITRLGWTFDSSQFDNCQLISDVLATLR